MAGEQPPRLADGPLAVDVFQVRPGLGQGLQLRRDSTGLVFHFAVVDVDPLHFETHRCDPRKDPGENNPFRRTDLQRPAPSRV